MTEDTKKMVAEQEKWDIVSKELEDENLKLMSYDNTLMSLFGDVKDKKVLDYGAGPGVLASGVKKMGGNVKVWDIGPEMRENLAKKIGAENVYQEITDVPTDFFDIIICNLVLCIVPEDEVKNIVRNIKAFLNQEGFAYVGFCNPKIFNVAESNLDFRFPSGAKYEENHEYKKIKKEGSYEIIETHRPIEWYEKIYQDAGLKLVGTFYTPEYELKGDKIKDFIIFKVKK
ncbi:MAG: class I SAM-dependent methyltransferase [Candidatus Staskawiczbacteria bacterium]|nr:class I SAM-dependent methyltransferase [Candidatus Staskawiczbacteria bacterium]